MNVKICEAYICFKKMMSQFWKKAKPFVYLLIILFVAYLPLSTFIFGMKNDAFSDNFPQKFFISECLHAGTSPLWNPYMNFGFPTYADMGFAFYNPVVWLFAAIGYNAYTLTAEVLLYIYIGGIAMYCLGRYFSFTNVVALAVASMYMCSGFYVGAIQHINALAAAAFFPFALLVTLRLLHQPCYKNSFLLSLVFYLIFASGHPALPIAFCYYLFVFLACYFVVQYRLLRNTFRFILIYFGLSVIIVILFMLPAIYSYINILPEYERYVKEVPYNVTASTSLSSLVSLLFPYATISHSSFFPADVSFRNLYISSIGLMAVLFGIKRENKLIIPLLLSGVFLLLLSLGNPVKTLLYNHLPLIKNVRTNGHLRSLFLLSCCCISGFGLQNMAQQEKRFQPIWKRMITLIIVLLVLSICLVFFINSNILFVFFHQLSQPSSITQKAKSFFERINFPAALLISLFLSLFIFLLLFFQKRYNSKTLAIVIILDLIINTLIYVPVTGVGTTTVKQIQAVYNTSPAGFPVPHFTPINKIDTLPEFMTGLSGSLSYYNKQIGILHLTDYPSYFTSTEQYFISSDTAIVNRQPFLFFKSNTAQSEQRTGTINITSFAPAHMVVQITTKQPDTLVYLQNNDHHWRATIDNKRLPLMTAYHTFISVVIPAGISIVTFTYDDQYLVWLIFASALSLLIGLTVFIRTKKSVATVT